MIEWLLQTTVRYIADVAVLLIVMLVQALGAWLLWTWPTSEPEGTPSTRIRALTIAGILISYSVVIFGFLLRFDRVNRNFPKWWTSWGRGMAITWAFLSIVMVGTLLISRWWLRIRGEHSPGRRKFLHATQAVLLGAPAAAMGYGVFIERFDLRLREQDLVFPDLPKDLDGLRLVQLTDIHLSPFVRERDVARAVDMANETRAHIALVTGDLITYSGDPVDVCLAQLARLKTDGGIFGCMGNHEIYANAEKYVEQNGARLGMQFLRHRAVQLTFGDTVLNLAGVDYQRTTRPYLRGAKRLIVPGAFNVLLSHNPDVFPVAAQQGYRCTIAGHTHGGQVRVEIPERGSEHRSFLYAFCRWFVSSG